MKKDKNNLFKNKKLSIKKSVATIALTGLILASPLMLTGCTGEKGAPGTPGSVWHTGTEYTECTNANIGDFFLETDGDVYIFMESGWSKFTTIKGDKGDKGDTGATGNPGSAGKGISSISKTTEGLVDTYTITFTDGTTNTFTLTNGANGLPGTNGKGIKSINKTTEGLVDTYTITYTDDTTYVFTLTNGADGLPGAAGKGIKSVNKTTEGLVDTYTITYTDNTTYVFSVTNGDNGSNGTSFLSGNGVPQAELGTTGDTYLDLETYKIYKKAVSGWEIVGTLELGTELCPIYINDVNDFKNIKTTGNVYYKLANDIDLSDVKDEFTKGDALISSFEGVIDGNEKTIYLPEELSGSYGMVISEFNGILKNVTISYANVRDGQEINWSSSNSKATLFENVIIDNVDVSKNTNEILDLPSSATNFSPFINFASADLTFKNCTNKLSFAGIPYGSAFLGGYINSPSGIVFENDGSISSDKVGFVKNVKLSFINCTNEGRLYMEEASLLQGHSNRLPVKENLIISNVVNNGTIQGTASSAIYCSKGTTAYSVVDPTDFRRSVLTAWNAEIESNNNKVSSSSAGDCVVNSLTNFVATYTGENNLITITNPLEDSNNDYVYDINIKSYITKQGAVGTAIVNAAIRIEDAGETNIGYYNVVDTEFINNLENITKTEIEGASITYTGAPDLKLYLIEDQSGNKYYYFNNAEDTFVYDAAHLNYRHNVTAFKVESDTSLTISGQVVIQKA